MSSFKSDYNFMGFKNIYTATAVLEINLAAIKYNYNKFLQVSKTKVASVVKANCYGLGVQKIVPFLYQCGCNDFFVANCDEGVVVKQLLSKRANVYILFGVFADNVNDLVANNLIPVINNLQQLSIWYNQAKLCQKKLPCVIHVDSGLNRLGLTEQELLPCFEILKSSFLDCYYIMSHMINSKNQDNIINYQQLLRFRKITQYFQEIKKSLSNSWAVLLGKKYHFDLIRVGGGLYGINAKLLALKSVIRLFVPIIQIKQVKSGESVGYEATFNVENNMLIAVIAIGYADGLPISLSNKGCVYINNQIAPIIGRISMDLTTIDVTNIAKNDIFLGQKVEVIGDNNNLDKVANLAGIISYDLVTRLGNRLKKSYIS